MQQQIEQLDCRDSTLSATDDAVKFIDIAITNLHDSETSQVLQKYGFNIHHLRQDLKACKENVSQIQNYQQRYLDAFDNYSKIKRGYGIMPEGDVINYCLEEIGTYLRFKDESHFKSFLSILNSIPDNRHTYAQLLEDEKNIVLQNCSNFNEQQEIRECFDEVINTLRT
jgi:hypothetical protein